MGPQKNIEKLIAELVINGTESADKRILNDALTAYEKSTNKSADLQPGVWRIIMKNKTTKFAAAAVIVIGISVLSWFSSSRKTPENVSSFYLLSKACAAEQALFNANGIIHIVNEIVLYPKQERSAGKLLNDMESETKKENYNDKNLAFVKSWLSYRWFPVYSLGTDGQPHEYKLEIAENADKAVTISDTAWYDSSTGRFARVLKTGDNILFANAYDGEFIYLAKKEPNGLLRINKEAIIGTFRVPENPADFLGIAAGIKGSVPQEHFPPIQNVATEILQDNTPVRVYKMGFTDPWGKVDTYFLFKVNTNTDIIGEIECVADGKTTRVHRRIADETVNSPEISWDMSELSTTAAKQGNVNVGIETGARAVTVQQMAQQANIPVYIFAKEPSWTDGCKIYDLPDDVNKSTRVFSATYHAKDGRDISLTQGETFKRYFSDMLTKFQGAGETVPWTYESENGFKVMHQSDKEGEMWWTEFALKCSGFEPRANRIGYILMSPAKTFLTLAINGPVSEQELHDMIDSLIPASEYVSDSVQP